MINRHTEKQFCTRLVLRVQGTALNCRIFSVLMLARADRGEISKAGKAKNQKLLWRAFIWQNMLGYSYHYTSLKVSGHEVIWLASGQLLPCAIARVWREIGETWTFRKTTTLLAFPRFIFFIVLFLPEANVLWREASSTDQPLAVR